MLKESWNKESWNLKNEWLNDFAKAFARDTRRFVSELSIEAESDRVAVRGRAKSYHAVQLAIHSAQNFSRHRPHFETTQLRLKVHGRWLEFSLNHQPTPTDDIESRFVEFAAV